MRKVVTALSVFVGLCAAIDLPLCGDPDPLKPAPANHIANNQGKFATWHTQLQALLWVDSPAFTPAWTGSIVYAFCPRRQQTFEVLRYDEATVGSVLPRASGGIVFAVSEPLTGGQMFNNSFWAAEIDADSLKAGNVTMLASLPASTPGKFNNGKCDPTGRYLANTYEYGDESGKAAVWTLQQEAGQYTVEQTISGLNHPNGLVWVSNGTELLLSETADNAVYKYKYPADGTLGKPQTWIVGDDSVLFDSMCGLQDGSVLIADPKHGRLLHYSEAGLPLCQLPVPGVTEFVASCTFDADGGELFVPTGRNGGGTQGPAGWLFSLAAPPALMGQATSECNL